MDIREIVSLAPVIPVVTLEDPAKAVPLARALVAGGLRVIEMTLRTEAAYASVQAMIREVADAVVGFGTVTRLDQFAAAADIGARFAVSPGLRPELIDAARRAGIPYLPGVATASELMAATTAGFGLLKFFPAGPAGGIPMLKALHGPFPDVRFCPTGGIDAGNAPDYLALPNVVAVGGSWVTPKSAIDSGDWQAIAGLALQASQLRKV
jgi:2-dehydro-3-deoxyphosphogluconate aldolase / (4S)-4-hydroxy-2-oxoglutarate aldolase